MSEQDFAIGITGDDLAGVSASDGTGFKRVPFGDYTFKIVEIEQKAKEGAKPHVMLKATFSVVEAADPANNHAVGMTVDGLFAGSPQSPNFMQARLKNLLQAASVTLKGGQGLKRSDLIGRQFAGTVVWELSQARMDPTTGVEKRYVNARVVGERPTGTARPAAINPEGDSRDAIAYLEAKYGDAGVGSSGGEATAPPPWAAPAPETKIETPAASGFRPESEADGTHHTYRAYVKLKTQYEEQARNELVKAGFDPDGPIDPEKLTDPTVKQAYLAKFPTNGALPGLPALGAPTAKKGTRAARV